MFHISNKYAVFIQNINHYEGDVNCKMQNYLSGNMLQNRRKDKSMIINFFLFQER
jgi:hypothetical protein